ncbi:hypothetical protein [Noviherbaspirillum galbum]|uniref:Transmembrane protein n=1 Tax=Noviherbaspirillum galbum TaxID=2709383 RepID=A0A6B3SGL5_9BURK|nr:hypothetical protein [Noviherbaspirillum galbum]NEX59808.1 hypothetical protein [Noviherbaspirillum galbum]
MYIVAIAWMYVVLMMSITEHSVVAGIATFLLYGVLPLVIILYLMGTPQRKRNRVKAEKLLREEKAAMAPSAPPDQDAAHHGEEAGPTQPVAENGKPGVPPA